MKKTQLANAIKESRRTSSQNEAEQLVKSKLALVLASAWVRYIRLFGEVPHGTPVQLAAMLELADTAWIKDGSK